MKRLFIEAEYFKKRITEIGELDLLHRIQNKILKNPEVGTLVKNSGGIRKFRMGTKGKGKSGGLRIFYLDLPMKEKCYLLFILEKSEAENINAEEKQELKELVEILKKRERT